MTGKMDRIQDTSATGLSNEPTDARPIAASPRSGPASEMGVIDLDPHTYSSSSPSGAFPIEYPPDGGAKAEMSVPQNVGPYDTIMQEIYEEATSYPHFRMMAEDIDDEDIRAYVLVASEILHKDRVWADDLAWMRLKAGHRLVPMPLDLYKFGCSREWEWEQARQRDKERRRKGKSEDPEYYEMKQGLGNLAGVLEKQEKAARKEKKAEAMAALTAVYGNNLVPIPEHSPSEDGTNAQTPKCLDPETIKRYFAILRGLCKAATSFPDLIVMTEAIRDEDTRFFILAAADILHTHTIFEKEKAWKAIGVQKYPLAVAQFFGECEFQWELAEEDRVAEKERKMEMEIEREMKMGFEWAGRESRLIALLKDLFRGIAFHKEERKMKMMKKEELVERVLAVGGGFNLDLLATIIGLIYYLKYLRLSRPMMAPNVDEGIKDFSKEKWGMPQDRLAYVVGYFARKLPPSWPECLLETAEEERRRRRRRGG